MDSRKGFSNVKKASWRAWLAANWRVLAMTLWAVAYFLGQPPMQWPLGGWLSCVAFAVIVVFSPGLTRREYVLAWFFASLVWLALLQGIRLAFWPLTAGWIALSLYLAIYLPISLAIAFAIRDRLRMATPLACAVGWTAGEVLRAYVITGFAGCMLAHSQTPWTAVLQFASHLGGYGVGFMMMLSMAWVVAFVASLVANDRPGSWDRVGRNGIALIVMMWMSSSFTGLWRRDAYLEGLQPIKPIGRFLLIQDNMPTQFDATPDLVAQGWLNYKKTTRQAARSIADPGTIDVVVWPESVFAGPTPFMIWDRNPAIPPELGLDRSQLESSYANLQDWHAYKLDQLKDAFEGRLPKLLMGTDVIEIKAGTMNRYNAALWINSHSVPHAFYSKNHLVMFGEYIPILSWFPGAMKMIGLGTLANGESPQAWELDGGRRIAPSICFENVVPHLMHSHVQRLTQAGKAPDVLINISNDGWFRGSSILDHHLNSAILTAVENRTPMLVAANTGITAWIDGDGRVVERLPKLEPGWIVAEPLPDGRDGWWSRWGDFPARCIAVLGLMPLALSLVDRIRKSVALRRS